MGWLHFFVVNAGEYVIDTNELNAVDTFFRRISMTARQILQEFGEEHVPNIVKTAAKYKTGNASTTRFDVIQAVYPRNDRTYGKMTANNMPLLPFTGCLQERMGRALLQSYGNLVSRNSRRLLPVGM